MVTKKDTAQSTPQDAKQPTKDKDRESESKDFKEPALKPAEPLISSEELKKSEENDLNKIKTDLEEGKKQIAALTETAARALADLQNFRRRSEEDKKSFVQFANSALILEILPTLDHFKRAFDNIPPELKNHDLITGFKQIEKSLLTALEKTGLITIEALGKAFDPHLHEALMEAPGEKGLVIEEITKGYLLFDRVLRPSKVKVGNGASNSSV